MNIGRENMLKRWNALSDCQKYGTDPGYTAATVCNLMESLANYGTKSDLTEDEERLLRGFQINEGYYAEDGFSFVSCLDLHEVSIDSRFDISALDHYFMALKVNGISFMERWINK